ncbi:MAG TPA: septation protein A [Rhodocyclaceae bacterium]|nr:septation protein A [Rhodocyclaceae bacterium]
MKLLFDLFPVILFFATYRIAQSYPDGATTHATELLGHFGAGGYVSIDQAPILLATVAVIAGTLIQVAWVWFHHGKVDKMLWVSLVLVTVFGGMTLAFRDDTFIKWKPTVLYWVFALSLFFSAKLAGKNLVKAMLGTQLSLPEPVWGKLSFWWVLFFLFMGAANLFVALSFSNDVWVNFKLFGGTGLMLVFMLAQGYFLLKYIEPEPQSGRQDEAK